MRKIGQVKPHPHIYAGYISVVTTVSKAAQLASQFFDLFFIIFFLAFCIGTLFNPCTFSFVFILSFPRSKICNAEICRITFGTNIAVIEGA